MILEWLRDIWFTRWIPWQMWCAAKGHAGIAPWMRGMPFADPAIHQCKKCGGLLKLATAETLAEQPK